MDNKPFWGSKHPSTIVSIFIDVAFLLLVEYGNYNHMTMLEDSMAKEIQIKERLLEEQKRLKVELATLESPQRIEAFAKDRLQMQYPDNEQIIVKKKKRPFMKEKK